MTIVAFGNCVKFLKLSIKEEGPKSKQIRRFEQIESTKTAGPQQNSVLVPLDLSNIILAVSESNIEQTHGEFGTESKGLIDGRKVGDLALKEKQFSKT